MIVAILCLLILSGCTAKELTEAEEYERQGNWDAAVTSYREVLKQDPFNKEAEKKWKYTKKRAGQQHFIRGRQLLEDGQVAEALKEFEIAMGYDPSNPEHSLALTDAWRLKNARQTLVDAKQMESLGF